MSSQRSVPRPKRAGEEFTRTHYGEPSGTDAPSAKKPRFDVRNPSALAPDAIEEDAILDADEIGKRGQQTKRSAVNIDGYDSDSSNEGFDARADAKAKASQKDKGGREKSKAEEESDMFADLDEGGAAGGEGADGDDDEEFTRQGKKKAKSVRFLGEEEIEGQVTNSKAGGHVSADFSINGHGPTRSDASNGSFERSQKENDEDESGSSSEASDSERAAADDDEIGAGGKKSHAPRLDAFNMKSEQEEGRFDQEGNYVRKAVDPDAVHDSWLEGISKKDMKRAKEAMDKQEEEQRQKRLADDSLLTSDVLKSLITQLERGETPLEALARLGPGKKAKQKPKWQQKAKRKGNEDEMDLDRTNSNGDKHQVEDPAEIRRRSAVEAITAAADQLLTRGQMEIYDTERESLTRLYTRETGEQWKDPPAPSNEVGEDTDQDPDPDPDAAGDGGVVRSTSPNSNANANAKAKQWEYRWADARDGGDTHGPFDGEMMRAWNEAGYFGEGVEFREVGEAGWSRLVDFV